MNFNYKSKSFEIEGMCQDDHIYQQICKTGKFYEIDLLEYIFKVKSFFYSKKFKNIVVDVGANIGNHSVFFGSFIADHLISVEPNPKVLGQLKRNLESNLSNYTLISKAVGDKESRGTIDVPEGMEKNVGASKVSVKENEGNIEVSTLDAVLESWQEKSDDPVTVCMIKIDVEGMEPQVLEGARKTILKHKPHIFAEAATNEELQKINDFTKPLGYRQMPGFWAATPVYHFVFHPSFYLVVKTHWWRFLIMVRRSKLYLERRFL